MEFRGKGALWIIGVSFRAGLRIALSLSFLFFFLLSPNCYLCEPGLVMTVLQFLTCKMGLLISLTRAVRMN